jgi:hypothetical protein
MTADALIGVSSVICAVAPLCDNCEKREGVAV